MKKVIIVESPNKINKIKSFLSNLDDEYEVISSVGHIRELSKVGKYGLGIDLDSMVPKYKESTDKKKVIKEINDISKNADEILLATDPDREGESIAWHVKEVIKNNEDKVIKRIIFNEITKEAVLKAIENPIELNYDLISSQESRRMLDRMIGFRLSDLTKKKISAKSSGRVKSSTLKMIIDREKEIESFVPETWYTLEVEIDKVFKLKYVDSKYNEIKLSNPDELNKIKESLSDLFLLKNKKDSVKTIKAPVPVEMSDLLMKGYSQLGFSNAQVTMISQILYEKGYITYPRTDSKRISSEQFISEVKDFISNETKSSFISQKILKSKNSQDAHEAIRPVSVNKTFDKITDLKPNELKLYKLIWKISVQSFMDPAKQLTTKYIYENNGHLFSISDSKITTEGFKELDDKKEILSFDSKKQLKISSIEKQIQILEHISKPPARYNQSSLIKKMKEEGIGRPSTYSATTNGLIKYNYLENDGGVLTPTEMGKEVINLLNIKFDDIINEKYTSMLEQQLDLISDGKLDSKKFLFEFWSEFSPRVDEANETIEKKMPEFVGRKCPEDGGDLVYKVSRFGKKFIGCLNFPDCKHLESLEPKKELELVGENCPECSKPLVYRYSSRTKEKFIGCSGFPKCKYVAKVPKN